MRKTVYKFYGVWAFESEERWLNKMAAQGLHLVSVGFCQYVFEKGTPGEYIVRLELLDNLPNHYESQQYIEFVEETGAQYLGNVTRWIYFRKKSSPNGFDLFSDIDSKINHLKRILYMLIPFAILLLTTSISNLISAFTSGFLGNMIVGFCNCALFSIFMFAIIKLWLVLSKLKKSRKLHE